MEQLSPKSPVVPELHKANLRIATLIRELETERTVNELLARENASLLNQLAVARASLYLDSITR